MDTLLPLLLMLLLYLIPELLKKRKQPKDYEYPDIPEKVPPPVVLKPKSAEMSSKPADQSVPEFAGNIAKAWAMPQKSVVAMPAPVVIPHTTEPDSPWQGKLSPQLVQNGFVFAEIIQPPRAYRPLWRQRK